MANTNNNELVDVITDFDKYIDAGLSKEELLSLVIKVRDNSNGMRAYNDGRGIVAPSTIIECGPDLLVKCCNRFIELLDSDLLASLPENQLSGLHAFLSSPSDEFYLKLFRRIIISETDKFPESTRAKVFKAMITLSCWPRDNAIEHNESFWRKANSLIRHPAQGEFVLADPNTFTFYDGIYRHYKEPSAFSHCAAITTDNPTAFHIALDLAGRRMSKNILLLLVKNNAINIISDFLSTTNQIEKVYSPTELLFFASASMPGSLALKIIEILATKYPGICRDSRDLYGNNALWYTLYRGYRCGWQHNITLDNTEGIVQLLIKNGCDPEHHNCLHLSFKAVHEA